MFARHAGIKVENGWENVMNVIPGAVLLKKLK